MQRGSVAVLTNATREREWLARALILAAYAAFFSRCISSDRTWIQIAAVTALRTCFANIVAWNRMTSVDANPCRAITDGTY
jgi:hypothetical protein